MNLFRCVPKSGSCSWQVGINQTHKRETVKNKRIHLKQYMSTMSIFRLVLKGLWNTMVASNILGLPLWSCHLPTFWVARSLGMRPATQSHWGPRHESRDFFGLEASTAEGILPPKFCKRWGSPVTWSGFQTPSNTITISIYPGYAEYGAPPAWKLQLATKPDPRHAWKIL